MRASEWVSFVYFAALSVIAWLRPLSLARRVQITIAGVGCAAFVTVLRPESAIVRDWMAAPLILVAYYMSGRFFVRPSASFEAWLAAWDRRLLGDPSTRFSGWPRSVLAYLEIVYMGCFVLVPAGFAVLVYQGHAEMADRYWTLVLAAELGSFAPLSVIQSRPPWLIERKATLPDRTVHRVASQMVEQFTIHANTFPSGHVAGSLAVALAVIGTVPLAGVVFLALAVSIAIACVAGRYHYTVDVFAGAGLTFLLWVVRQ